MSSHNAPRRRFNPDRQRTLASAVTSLLERLEHRQLLAAQVWANDNWMLRTDTGAAGLSVGDVVESTGAGDSGDVVTGLWGVDAFDTIAAAVNAVDAGGTVNVLAGQYEDNLNIDKAVRIVGQSSATTVLRSSGAAESIVMIRHSGVSISRITLGVDGSLGGGPDGSTTVGIDINGGSTSINNATISGNDIGVRVRNGGSILSMSENFVTNNAVAALEVQADAGAVSAVFNNDLSGPGMAVTNAGAAVVNASGNYFGADTTQAGVAARNSLAGVDFTPWLNVGTDTSANSGFQGQFTDVNVGSGGQQSGSVGRVREGVTLAAAGGNVFVHAGTYGESDISLDKSIVIDGVGSPAGVVIAPAVADAHATAPGSTFAAGTHNAFVVRSGDVTIKDLTIDGDAGVGGAGSMNFFGGVVYDYTLGQAFNNLQAKNLTVRNVWRVGIYFDGGINALSTGHTVMDNTVDNVSGGTGASAIAMLQASGAVTGNTITNVDGDGIATNYIDGAAFAPTISITGNTISGTQTGMNLSGLAAGSTVGGAGVGDENTITMTGGGDETGIIVQYAVGAVTVEGNTITGDGDDSGIYLYHNASGAAPTIVRNTLTSTSSTSTADGDGTGIFVTDDGSFFTESSGGHSFATISGNVISGFFRGIDLYRNEDNPAGGFTVSATIDGDNEISGGNTGVRVFDSNGTTAADAVALITGNSASIHGNAIGIDVAGGTATITNNHVYDNGVGVQVRDGGVATINNNDFDGGASNDNGTDVLVKSTAPNGITGGAMTGNAFAGSNFFIDNESTLSFDALTTAGNTFGALSNFRIEDRMHHRSDTDRALTTGRVTWAGPFVFVTDPAVGTSSTDSSIQHAIDAANAGETVHIEGGTYAEHVTINKAITLDGQGTGPAPAVNWTSANTSPLVTVTSTNTADDVTIHDVAFDGLNGAIQAGDGVRVGTAADFDTLTLNRSTFNRFNFDAVNISGNATTGISARNLVLTNLSFTNNGAAGSGGTGDVSLFQYNGDATFSDLTLVGSAGTTGARIGIQMRGVGDAAGAGHLPMGNVSMSNVDVSGSYRTSFLGLQRYANVSNLALSNVALGGATSEVGGTFGALLRIDAVGTGSVASPAGIDLGDTHFRGLAAGSAQQAFLEFAPDNNFTFLRADATDTRWDLSSGTGIVASSMTLPQAFEATDRMLDYVKPNHPVHGAFKGWAELQNGKAFNTPLSSNISRGVEMVDASGTVHVKEGSYNQAVTVNRGVTLAGAQAGVDGRGRAGPETVLTTDLADETLGIVHVTAANAVIDGFTIEGDGPAAGGVLLLDGVTSSNAARGVVVDADNVSVINNRINNTYRRGVQFWVNPANAPVGGLVNQNEFNVIGANVGTSANSGDAVLAFSDPTVTNNDVNTARTGVTFIQVYAPNVTPITISGNTIDAVNGIALNETSSGIPTITITNNTVTSDDNGTGLQLWTVDGDVTISGNAFTGSGVGDRGVYAWDGTANDAMDVTITGGSFSGYQTGVHLTNEEQAGPFGPSLAAATLTLDGVTIAAGSTGVFVEDTAAGTLDVRVNVIDDTNIATGGTGTGVRVSGPAARARVVDNDDSITNNLRGVDVDGGTALLQNNDLNGNTIGVLFRNGGVADLGQNGPGTDFTGLGISTGGNDFTGYTTAATASSGAIVNLNAVAAAGRQGLPSDVPAFNNVWAVNTASGIENVIYHDVDDAALGFVDYRAFAGLAVSLTSAAVNEGGTTTVNGSFTDVAMPHTITIVWGDGSPNTVVNLAAGVENFSIASPAGTTYGDDPDGPTNSVNHALSVTVKEDATTSTLTDNSLGVTVSNVAPTIALSGGSGVNEGAVYTLNLGAVTDPGDDTVTRYIINWGDGSFDDITGNPANTTRTHTYDDGTQARNITVSLFDEDAAPHFNTGTPDPFAVTVNNVAPTGNLFNGGPVPEGSAGFVGFGAQFDPSSADTTAGFLYSYDFNNDGDFTDALEHSDITNAAVGVPAAYLADGPGSRTIRARIKDKDGGFTDYTTTINIFNVTPFVSAGPDVNAPANIAWSQQGTFSDPGADSPWTATVDYDTSDANPPVPLALSGNNFTLSHSYASPGTYTVRVTVTDKDGATGQDELQVIVGPAPTFQVNQFLFNTSGFTLRFNRPVDTANLNLYDGLNGITPSAEAADLTLVGNSVGAVRGSLVWDPATNLATFVRTGGPLVPDTYTLTVRSAGNAFKDTTGGLLDGDANGSAGDDYVQTFNVTNFFDRTLSVPDFARGPDAGNNVNVPNTGALGIPVRIDDGAQVRSVDFRINYNPNLLNITGAQLAAGMPGDWAITSNLSTPGVAIITVFGTTTDLPSGPQNIVKLVANVPNNAPYQAAGALRFSNMTVSRNDATTISTRGDSGLHKVMYFGDADGDRAYTGFDAGLLSRVVVNLDSGFHAAPLVDPVVVGDIDGSGSLSGIDASFVAQKAALLPRAEIPDLPGVLPPLVPGGVDPLFSTPDNQPGRPGGTVTMPISIDDAAGTLGFNLTVDYDTNLLDLAGANVQLGALYTTAGGWSLVTNVDETTGHATLVFWRSSGVPMPAGSGGGEVATATFTVAPAAAHNATVPVDLDGNPGASGLVFTFDDGSVLVDAVAPTVLLSNYKYQTAPHTLAFQFSEDVFASLAAGDFVVVNTTTSTTIPASDFTLAYDANTNTATLSYVPSGGVLPDGNYTVTINAADVTDAAGNPLPGNHVTNFFFLMADANHDGAVNLADFNALAANFGQTPRDFTEGDFNYDGVVNLADFNILASRFGAQLGPGATIAPPTGNPPTFPPNLAGAIGAGDGAATTAGLTTTTSPGTPENTDTSTAASRPPQTTVGKTTTTGTASTSTSPFSTVTVGSATTPTTEAPAETSPYTSPVFADRLIARRAVVRPA